MDAWAGKTTNNKTGATAALGTPRVEKIHSLAPEQADRPRHVETDEAPRFDPSRASLPERVRKSKPAIHWDNALIMDVVKWWRANGQTHFTARDLYDQLVKQGVTFPEGMTPKQVSIKLSTHLKKTFGLDFASGIGAQVFTIPTAEVAHE